MDPNLIQAAQQLAPKADQSGALLFGMSMWGLLASLLFSGIGFVYFKYGRSNSDPLSIITGVILMGYSYFVSDALYIVVAGAGIMLGHWLLKKYA